MKNPTQSELIAVIMRAMVPHHKHQDDPMVVDVILMDLEDKDPEFLMALAVIAEIAIAREPTKCPEIVFDKDDAA